MNRKIKYILFSYSEKYLIFLLPFQTVQFSVDIDVVDLLQKPTQFGTIICLQRAFYGKDEALNVPINKKTSRRFDCGGYHVNYDYMNKIKINIKTIIETFRMPRNVIRGFFVHLMSCSKRNHDI